MSKRVNEELLLRVHELRRKGHTQSQIAEIVEVVEDRQIQRYLSKRWLEKHPELLNLLETSDKLDSDGSIRKPSSRLESLCEDGDHTWLNDDRYEGWARESEMAPLSVPWKDGGGGYAILRYKRTCWFCGHVSYV